MDEKLLQTLEYDKILRKLSEHAATELGKQRAEQLQPTTDFEQVKIQLSATDQAAMIVRLKGHPPFGGIRNLYSSLQRAKIGGVLNAQELLDIATTIHGGRRLKRALQQVYAEHPAPQIAELSEQIAEHRQEEMEISSCIDDQGDLLDRASPELTRIRHNIRTGEARIRERLEQMLRTPAVQKKLQEQLITMRNDRYVVPVKQEYRADFGGIVHDQSASGATLFIEPAAIVELNNKLREAVLKEQAEIERILTQLSALVAEIHDSLTVNLQAISELDFIFAKASYAAECKATLPRMNDRGFIKIKKGRHPLIAADAVVPIDIELGNDYTMIIVTGPNTGGKTVSLKTTGLLNLMAMSGLFIPAEDGSQMCVFDGIYADIGDEQSIEQNLSTFSSHMTNIIRILREITPKSLVLLDELGAGTDPAEGSALAISILEYIRHLGCRLVATTHYSELKAYAFEQKGIINASMEFDIQTLSPTYRLLIGIPGRSNAFAIAERLGLPKSIIKQSRMQVKSEDQQVDSMIASLESNRLTAESERQDAEKLRREVERLRDQLAQQQEKFVQQRDKLLLQAQEEARKAVAKARREADEIIADLRQLAKDEGAAIKEHKLIEAKRRLDLAEPALAARHDESVSPRRKLQSVQPGDEVFVSRFAKKGHVVELVDHDEVIVQLGVMKMKVKRSELEPVAPAKQSKPVQPRTIVKRSREQEARMELDIRGTNLEEALLEVDQFLDTAFLGNFGQVYIIHGKGTGILRNGIQQYLRKHKHVNQFRLGAYGEGGDGVTVVELK